MKELTELQDLDWRYVSGLLEGGLDFGAREEIAQFLSNIMNNSNRHIRALTEAHALDHAVIEELRKRVDRLDRAYSIGNGQVPAVARTMFELLTGN